MTDLIRKPLAWLIGALLIGLAAWWLAATLTGGKRAKVEAQLNKNQAGAALESGKDAVSAVSGAADRSGEADRITQENRDAIQKAPGAGAPVDPVLRDTGRRSLCKRAAYRERPECLQYASPR